MTQPSKEEAVVQGLPSPQAPASGEVFAFLLGEGPLEGCWFGDAPPNGGIAKPYWWRTHLRAALSTTQPASGEATPFMSMADALRNPDFQRWADQLLDGKTHSSAVASEYKWNADVRQIMRDLLIEAIGIGVTKFDRIGEPSTGGKLREVLEPFAKRADDHSPNARDDTTVHFRLRHCRAAREALSTSPSAIEPGIVESAARTVGALAREWEAHSHQDATTRLVIEMLDKAAARVRALTSEGKS